MDNTTVFNMRQFLIKKITQREVEMEVEIAILVLLWSVRFMSGFMTPGIFFCRCHMSFVTLWVRKIPV